MLPRGNTYNFGIVLTCNDYPFDMQVSSKDRRLIRNAKLARTGTLLLGVFALCWLPSMIVMTISLTEHLNKGKWVLSFIKESDMIKTSYDSHEKQDFLLE